MAIQLSFRSATARPAGLRHMVSIEDLEEVNAWLDASRIEPLDERMIS